MQDEQELTSRLSRAMLNFSNRCIEQGDMSPEVIARAAMAHALSVGEQTFGPAVLAEWLREAADRVEDIDAARLAANARGLN